MAGSDGPQYALEMLKGALDEHAKTLESVQECMRLDNVTPYAVRLLGELIALLLADQAEANGKMVKTMIGIIPEFEKYMHQNEGKDDDQNQPA